MSGPAPGPQLRDPLPTADAVPRRIHIIGGPGVGKTRLAGDLATATGLPVTHLDDIARLGGGDGSIRTAEEREPLVAAVLASDGWIVEGVHLGWTEPLLARADLIVWLDTAAWHGAARGIVRRFARGAWHEVRVRPWREKLTRFGDYARQLRSLVGALAGTRRYHGVPMDGATHPDRPPAAATTSTLGSRAATEAALAAHAARVIHCRTAADVHALLRRLTVSPSAPPGLAVGVGR